MMIFSKRIRELREEKNVLQKDVANYIGVSERVYGFYEAGRFPKDEEILKKIADYFDCTVDYLIGRVDNPQSIVIDKGLPKEFIDAGIQSIALLKGFNISDLTIEHVQILIDAANKLKKRQL